MTWFCLCCFSNAFKDRISFVEFDGEADASSRQITVHSQKGYETASFKSTSSDFNILKKKNTKDKFKMNGDADRTGSQRLSEYE